MTGTTGSERQAAGLEHVSLLHGQSDALAIVAVISTIFLVATAIDHRNIPASIRFVPETQRIVSTFPSPQTDAEQRQQYVIDTIGFAVGAVVFAARTTTSAR